MYKQIIITETNEPLPSNHWSYPLNELGYIIELMEGGDLPMISCFWLYEGRLYEMTPTEGL